MQYTGVICNGVVVLDNGCPLPDGTRVRLEAVESEPAPETLGGRLLKFAGKAEGLPADMAARHDHYLHGQERP
jgi:hypothetical protein